MRGRLIVLEYNIEETEQRRCFKTNDKTIIDFIEKKWRPT